VIQRTAAEEIDDRQEFEHGGNVQTQLLHLRCVTSSQYRNLGRQIRNYHDLFGEAIEL
jgi:hypothetical protein